MVDFSHSHRRYNPLTDQWILVSPERNLRPWNGAVETNTAISLSDYDPACYLCPGNTRANGVKNPQYTRTFVFQNDHPALTTHKPNTSQSSELFQWQDEQGECKVVCYSPSHSRTIAHMSIEAVISLINTWKNEYVSIGKNQAISYIQIFENKGSLMGASNPHPHGQIWATEHIPTIPALEEMNQYRYFQNHKEQLLLTYLIRELEKKTRIIASGKIFTVLVPFWATWPYEALILPNSPMQSLTDFSKEDTAELGCMLQGIVRSFDKVFNAPFPYSMGIHQAPTDNKTHPEWQFHIHFYPPLLRSATIKKHFVGYELMAEAQRDMTPEKAAEILRSLYD